MQTHVVPVGFDYDRLIAPLIRDQVDVDRVILLKGAVGSESNVEYSQNLSKKLEKDFKNLLGADTNRVVVADVYDYDAAFEQAYDLINDQLDIAKDAEVWVNVSAMPRPVSFAYATAAHSIMVERQADRDRIHTYYTAPEKYLETELAEEVRAAKELLGDILDSSNATEFDQRIRERHQTAADLIEEFDERGTTIGAKPVDGGHIIELPVASFRNVKPFEKIILFELGEYGEFDSVSELAEMLARDMNEEYTDSFRSKVIYNVDRLGPGGKGYIEQEDRGKSYRTRLSHIGQLWVRAHAEDDDVLAQQVQAETDTYQN